MGLPVYDTAAQIYELLIAGGIIDPRDEAWNVSTLAVQQLMLSS